MNEADEKQVEDAIAAEYERIFGPDPSIEDLEVEVWFSSLGA